MRWRRPAPTAALVPLLVAVLALAGGACSSGSGGDAEAGATTTSAVGGTTSTTTTTTTTTTNAAASVVDAACDGRLESTDTVTVRVRPLVEASGLAVSRTNDGVIWAHNDSGDSARVFALGEDGGRLGTFRLAGADAVDWEDMALGPAADADGELVDDRDALYVADVGDNDAVRPSIVLYRVPEPEVSAGSRAGSVRLEGVERYPFVYPDGPRDAEALFIDRTDASFYVIEKRLAGGPVGIYRGPLDGWNDDPAAMPTLERVGTFRPGPSTFASVTGADLSPDGSVLAVRTYGSVRLFERPAGADLADVLAGESCRGPIPLELQGEAVAVTPDGGAYFTLPEGPDPLLSRWAP